ncbi:Mak10 subunit, NatC N-terminal acetyltransferase-domain-containing protein [Phycomyces nitens]|nr:Mak10 subunit, NatC N-terminal acetyltransferase-domain-containing protein [Phycomyces nitens]
MSQVNKIQQVLSELNITLVGRNDVNIPNDQDDVLLPEWKDITEFLNEATNDFKVGQLVHLPSFTLFDAMSAIEIMDPKMDTGMVLAESEKGVFDVSKRISAPHLVWIMDRLLSYEMAWISGHSLSQTVFTCTYFHHITALAENYHPPAANNPAEVIYSALRTYILATVKCCNYVWNEMAQGNVFEEEDFTTNLFGLHLCEQFSDVRVLNDLDTSVHLVGKLIENKPKDIEMNDLKAILHRLEARKAFLVGLVYLSQPHCSHFSQARAELRNLLDILRSSSPDSIRKTMRPDYVLEGAFDPNVNRKLVSQAPPRPIILHSDEESYDNFVALAERLESICSVPEFPSTGSLINYFAYFAAKPYPDALSRSTLNTSFYHDMRIFGTHPPSQLIQSAIEELVQPPEWWLASSKSAGATFTTEKLEQAHDMLNQALERATPSFIDLFKIQCQNRARQRRIQCKVVKEWDVLQETVAAVDEVFHEASGIDSIPYYMSSWAFHIKLDMIENILGLGFELELYGVHEYIMVYWYMQYILDSRMFLADRIQSFVSSESSQANNSQHGTGVQKSNWLYCLSMLFKAKKNLVIGVYRLLRCVVKTGQLELRPLGYDDEATRYQHRFKSFAGLASPPAPSYETYANDQSQNINTSEWLYSCLGELKEAKSIFDTLLNHSGPDTKTEMCEDGFKKELLAMMRTCVANSVAAMRLLSADPTTTKVDIEFKYHPWWPVIQLVNK